jgi:DNA-binding transcriptional LysR family regulator
LKSQTDLQPKYPNGNQQHLFLPSFPINSLLLRKKPVGDRFRRPASTTIQSGQTDPVSSKTCSLSAVWNRLLDRWRFRTKSGVEEIKVGGQFSNSSGDVLHAWALDGRGLSLEALWDVAEDLQAGRLVECLADYWCDSIDLFAAFLPGRPARPRIRLFVDFIAATSLR